MTKYQFDKWADFEAQDFKAVPVTNSSTAYIVGADLSPEDLVFLGKFLDLWHVSLTGKPLPAISCVRACAG